MAIKKLDKIKYENKEVISKSDKALLVKFEKTNDFIQFFVENLEYVALNLTGTEARILFLCMMKMNYKNILVLTSDLRRTISGLMGITPSAVTQNLQGLIKKEVLIHLNPAEMSDEAKDEFNLTGFERKNYLVNPNIIGKGSFRDLTKVRQTVIKEFDFNKLEYKKELLYERSYDGLEQVIENAQEHEVKNINMIEHDRGKDIEVVIEEKQNGVIKAKLEKVEPDLFSNLPNEELSNSFNSKDTNGEKDETLKDIDRIKKLIETEKERYINREKEIYMMVDNLKDRLVKEGKIEEYMKLSETINKMLSF
ncbi:hypothetical protein CUPS4256_08180 [Campylobacter upsaliensis]|uniref:hypothetical protein n=1 Tax=Campylobacter upsaliensis TaxID=28080 RepID=UPI002149CCB3|nr:hypothetical protein [Campylobacter upsaliensis]MCR2099151.1 hypothetical protein [Campylobacter upsaliensis]MCR2103216.1 hypothetical protein [Campylobacter upsaliensis]